MDDGELSGRWLRSRVAGYAAITAAADGGEHRTLLTGAVDAFRVPAVRHLSVSNGVLPADDAVLAEAVDLLAPWYGGAAWLVWLAPWQVARGAEVLAPRGFVLDEPAWLMAAPLADMDLDPRGHVDVEVDGDLADLVGVVDAGFELPPGMSFAPAFAGRPPAGLRRWIARVDGAPAASAVSVRCDDDVWFAFVSTRPALRRRGLAAEVMRTALRAARAEGCTSTSLESTARGRGLYAGLGYRDLGPMALWERPAV